MNQRPFQFAKCEALAVLHESPHAQEPKRVVAPNFWAAAVSVALLPFENQTGEAQLDWVELGLMSMVVKALSADTRLSLPSIPSLLTALGTLSDQAPREEREHAVRRLLGVRHVVQVTIGHDGDQYWLDYVIAPLRASKRLFGLELTQLGQRLATELESAMFIADCATVQVAYESADPLANRAFARALQAAGEQKWSVAINLFRVVLDIEPLNTGARLEHLRALAALGDDAAPPLGEQLLVQGRESRDDRLTFATHQALGQTCLNKHMFDAAKHHLHEAVRLAEAHGWHDDKSSTLILMSIVAIYERDFTRFHELTDEVRSVVDSTGNRVDALRSLHYSALAATKQGDPLRGLQLGRQAVLLSKAYRLEQYRASASLNLVYPCVDLGLMREAVGHGEEALATARSTRDRNRIVSTTETLCWLYRELRAPTQSARVMDDLQAQDLATPRLLAEVLRARSHHATAKGAYDEAADCLRQAIAVCQDMRNWLYVHEATPWFVMSLVLCGRTDEAMTACVPTQALPGFEGDFELQAGLGVCRALIAHSRGEHAEACRYLVELVDTAPAGLWRAYACLNGAWLAMEAHDMPVARMLMQGLGPWLSEHPVGMVVDARFKYACGEYSAACETHRRYAASIECTVPAYYALLGDIYSDAARHESGSVTPIPLTPRLPTVM